MAELKLRPPKERRYSKKMETTCKREYVLTEARLKANRANLEKARAASRESRSRMTEKKLAACRANLVKARAAPRKSREGFRHSIESSLKAAREKLEDFREHLKKFERRFRPQDGMEARLVRGLAEAAWRRLRVFRRQARWEARELARVLRGFGRRAGRGDPSPGRQGDYPLPAGEGSSIGGGETAELKTRPPEGRRSLPASGQAPSGATEERAGASEEQTHGTQSVPWLPKLEEMIEARAVVLRVLEALHSSAGMWRRVVRLNRRMACLARLLLTWKEVSTEGLDLWRIGPKTEENVINLPDPLLGNPFVSLAEFWRQTNRESSDEERSRTERKLARPVTRATKTDQHEDRSLEEWRDLFERALGALEPEERELAARIAETAWRRLEVFRERAEREAEELARILDEVDPLPGRQSDHPFVPSLTRREAENSGRATNLPAATAPDAGETPALQEERAHGIQTMPWLPEPGEMRGAVMRLMRVFGDEPATHEAAFGLERQLADGLEEWLLGRCGSRPRFGEEEAVGIENIEREAVGTWH